MSSSFATKTYASVGIESKVHSADPHMLISMLFQGALLAIANAKNGILRKDIPAKGIAISKAIAIIGEGLHASLDKKAGGEIAENLAALYDYMVFRLSDASINNDITKLDEVTNLLTDLKGAWDSIRPAVLQTPPPKAPEAKMQLVYGRGQ